MALTTKPYYHLQKSVDYINEHRFDIVHTHLSSSSDMYLFLLTSKHPISQPYTVYSLLIVMRVAI